MIIRNKKISIKQLLALVFLVAVMSFAFLVALTATQQVTNYLKKDTISDTRQLAELLAKNSRLAIIQMARENVMPSVQTALDFPDVKNIVIYEKSGHLLLGEAPSEIDFSEIARSKFEGAKSLVLKETTDTIFIVSPVIIETLYPNRNLGEFPDTEQIDAKSSDSELIGFVLVTVSKADIYNTQLQVWHESLFIVLGKIGASGIY
jgi:hypothetical protein